MTLSVRLDEETQKILEKTAKVMRTTKSRIVKLSLHEYCSRVLEDEIVRPYEHVKDLLGRRGSGRGDLSIRGEEILRRTMGRRGDNN